MTATPAAEVERIDRIWIPLPNGRRLAGRLWLPVGGGPAPVVIEAHPYRSADLSAIGDDARYRFLAGAGIAGLRIDLAGTGDSDGFLDDEYLPSEHDDVMDGIAWAADQPWCSGAVGLQGISWGGFNTLQVAARRPPALAGIISACASDNRYADDVHYLGGCVVGSEMLSWASTMLALNVLPPDPASVGASWETTWNQRIQRARFLAEEWLRHQHRDGYWDHGSVDVDYGAIECPVFLVGGWADGYRDGALRLASSLRAPVTMLIGPWGHGWPGELEPSAPVDFGAAVLAWWNWCLRRGDPEHAGRLAAPDTEEAVQVWLPDPADPALDDNARDAGTGSWLTGRRWPLPMTGPSVWHLRGGELAAAQETEGAAAPVPVPGRVSAVSYPGPWCGAGRRADRPGDQRADDARWLSFTTAALSEELVLLGAPQAELVVSAESSSAMVAARLCDVAPDGSSTLVTRGVLNLTHRNSPSSPEPLPSGEYCSATLALQSAAYRFKGGHRVRLSLSSSYWPLAWPSPRPATLSLDARHSRLVLPLLSGVGPSQGLSGRAHPAGQRGGIGFEVVPGDAEPTDTGYRPDDGRTVLTVPRGGPAVRLDSGRAFGMDGRDTLTSRGDDPVAVEATSTRAVTLRGEGWETKVGVEARMWCDEHEFHLDCRLRAAGGDHTAVERSFRASIARRWT